MITVKLMGGMGNQMFQYAAAMSVACHRKTSVALDLSFLLDRTQTGFVRTSISTFSTHRTYKSLKLF